MTLEYNGQPHILMWAKEFLDALTKGQEPLFLRGHVTHDFGHLSDVLTIVYSRSQQELSPEKSGIYLLPENIFSK